MKKREPFFGFTVLCGMMVMAFILLPLNELQFFFKI